MTRMLYVSTRQGWRDWLGKNQDKKKEVWLIYYRRNTDKLSIAYDDSVEEALCFGWVDSIIRKIDSERYARKFTPRSPRSKWSEVNRKRAEKMMVEGKMTDHGWMLVREAQSNGKWFETTDAARYRNQPDVPQYFERALAANRLASDNFRKLPQSYRTKFIAWVDSAKKEETRRKRLAEVVGLLQRNKKLGMK